MLVMAIRIETLSAPSDPTAPPSWLADGAARVSAASDRLLWGNGDFGVSGDQVAASLLHQGSTEKVRLIAVESVSASTADPGTVVGYAFANLPLKDNLTTAHVDVIVRPDCRNRGIGSQLLAEALAAVTQRGRTVIQGYVGFAHEPGPDEPGALAAPTGSGYVPGEDPSVRWALAHGAKLEQAERHSVLPLPVDASLLAQFREEAQARAGADYEIVAWSDQVPQDWIEQYCVLRTAMSTDAPSAGMAYEEERWDAGRIRTSEKNARDQGYRTITVAAHHRPTGELGGYTEIAVDQAKPHAAFQDNTIVRTSHRGRRLGMLLKAANLQRLAAEFPDAERVHTWNAEENSYMLDINVALGFRPAGGSAAVQLTLTGQTA